MTSADVLDALAVHHPANAWAFFREFVPFTSFQADRRFDAYAIAYWPSLKKVIRCFEVKVSRGDWLRELKQPEKRELGMELSNEFWFVAPAGIIKKHEVPEGCGLMEVTAKGVKRVVKPAHRDIPPPPWEMFAALARRTFDAEGKARTLTWPRTRHNMAHNVVSAAQLLANYEDFTKPAAPPSPPVPKVEEDKLYRRVLELRYLQPDRPLWRSRKGTAPEFDAALLKAFEGLTLEQRQALATQYEDDAESARRDERRLEMRKDLAKALRKREAARIDTQPRLRSDW